MQYSFFYLLLSRWPLLKLGQHQLKNLQDFKCCRNNIIDDQPLFTFENETLSPQEAPGDVDGIFTKLFTCLMAINSPIMGPSCIRTTIQPSVHRTRESCSTAQCQLDPFHKPASKKKIRKYCFSGFFFLCFNHFEYLLRLLSIWQF